MKTTLVLEARKIKLGTINMDLFTDECENLSVQMIAELLKSQKREKTLPLPNITRFFHDNISSVEQTAQMAAGLPLPTIGTEGEVPIISSFNNMNEEEEEEEDNDRDWDDHDNDNDDD